MTGLLRWFLKNARVWRARSPTGDVNVFRFRNVVVFFLFSSPFLRWMVSDHLNRKIDEFFKLHESWPSQELRIVVNLLDVSQVGFLWRWGVDYINCSGSRYWLWLKNSEVLIQAKLFSSFCNVLHCSETEAVSEYEAHRPVLWLQWEV